MMIAQENPKGTPARIGTIQWIAGLLVLLDVRLRTVSQIRKETVYAPSEPEETDR